MVNARNISFVFFGSSHFSVRILDMLAEAGYTPSLIITVPDKPKGRKLVLTPPEAKVWADEHHVPCLQPASLKSADVEHAITSFAPGGFDVGIVASYGKIIPESILNIPRRGMLNVHPSLLPRLRGASPIQSAILSESSTGVTIMHLDAEMDHGPIVATEEVSMPEWPPYASDLREILAVHGGQLLSSVLPGWVDGTVPEKEQNHAEATYCKKIEKADGEINIDGPALENLCKIRAYHEWPGAFFLFQAKGKTTRVIVKKARLSDGKLLIERVVPEGKKEMDYADFLRGYGANQHL